MAVKAEVVRTMEEFINGRDGDRKKGAIGYIQEALEAAQKAGIPSVRVEVRKEPPGGPSVQDSTFTLSTRDDIDNIAQAIVRHMEGTPGNHFRGVVRLNISEAGKSGNQIKGVERFIEPLTTGENGNATDGKLIMVPLSSVDPLLLNLIRASDALVRAMDAGVRMIEGVGKIVNPPEGVYTGGKVASSVGERLLGVMASGMMGGPEAAAKTAAAAVKEELQPEKLPEKRAHGGESSASSAPSTSARPVTDEEAEAWARANPDRARAMGLKLMQEG